MGRGRRRKQRRAETESMRYAHSRPVKGHKRLLDHARLDALWRDGRCSHPNPVAAAYGLGAILSCRDCNARMSCLLKFGRPKSFDVTIEAGGTKRRVGRASVDAVDGMVNNHGTPMMLPDGGFDPKSVYPVRDEMMLKILMETLTRDVLDGALQEPAADFAAAWRGTGCDHKNTGCQAYCNIICLWCDDCAAMLTFTYVKSDMFTVELTRRPLEPVSYGPHGADAVANVLREYAGTLELPGAMADRMSDDPERDARRMGKMVGALEKCGLLRRVADEDIQFPEMRQTVSALNCDRADFEKWVGPMGRTLRSLGVRSVEYGRRVDERRTLEAMRLAWPCWFEGDGIEIDAFDPAGSVQFCVKCGFSTLDDKVGADHWERGCPECGYDGYLLGLDESPAGSGRS